MSHPKNRHAEIPLRWPIHCQRALKTRVANNGNICPCVFWLYVLVRQCECESSPLSFLSRLFIRCLQRPTLLAKVFGCFKVSYRKSGKDKGPNKSKSMQINLLVMENLFYDKRFSKVSSGSRFFRDSPQLNGKQIYDLKGSTRNRHVQSTGRENEVLLDENLVEAAYHNPLYLREHSKRILRGALYNDSKFLADINVMDYSLVCGVSQSCCCFWEGVHGFLGGQH